MKCLAWIAAALLTLVSSVAMAALTRVQIDAAGFERHVGRALPRDSAWREADGRPRRLGDLLGKPTLMVLVDYTCTTLCGVVVNQLADALKSVDFRAGEDYRVLVVGFNPRDGSKEASEYRDARVGGTPFARTTHFLSGDEAAIAAMSTAVGLRASYDAERKQYAHPSAVVLADAQGVIRRYLDPLAVTPFDLRLALAGSDDQRLAGVADRIALLCYGWDAATGVYTFAIRQTLAIVSAATVLAVFVAILAFLRRERRLHRSGGVS